MFIAGHVSMYNHHGKLLVVAPEKQRKEISAIAQGISEYSNVNSLRVAVVAWTIRRCQSIYQ